ncbi:hypothetical protein RR42_s3252 [Cupriavidus basilensis]|uniref:Uncharacterized protein n=1 Tax=Cupriavidus basilensis TaxID=68895 RepID=A0A0C4YP70_9BURK|nr:hypothetical protein RR42_s3252 [Cupriavidus basilensis]
MLGLLPGSGRQASWRQSTAALPSLPRRIRRLQAPDSALPYPHPFRESQGQP